MANPPIGVVAEPQSITSGAPSRAADGSIIKNPFLWVPTSYLTMGLIYVTVTSVATIMFKNLGMDNAQATSYSSLLGLPYVIKPLWAPLLELYKTKKFFVVLMQFVVAVIVAVTAFTLKLPGSTWVMPAVALLGLTGLAGATQDIGSDGVYVTTLPSKSQAQYLGVQSMCWNIGFLLATSLFVGLSGVFHDQTGSWGTAWMIVLMTIACFTFAMGLYHARMLPPGAKASDAPKNASDALRTFGLAFLTFFQKKGIVRMIAFAFLYRFGLGLLDKMGPLFLIDPRSAGGLGLSNQRLSLVNGIGTLAFIAASLAGGVFVSKKGLKASLLILCLCVNIPNATFLILSQTMTTNIVLITAVVIVEKFGWGFGAVGHMIYMMQQIAPGRYKTAHYAFATAFMGLCMMLTGWLSGRIQKVVGYQGFFVVVLVAAIPSIIATLGAPFYQKTDDAKAAPDPA
jgi:PAT family beta-lactamase induction signal transducer AmpG